MPDVPDVVRTLAAKITAVEEEHCRLIRAYLQTQWGRGQRVTDSAIVRYALDRVAQSIYEEIAQQEKDRVEASE